MKKFLSGLILGALLATAIPVIAQLANTLRIVPSTSTTPSLSATGSGANIDVVLTPKGTGGVVARNQLRIAQTTAPTLATTGALGTIAGSDSAMKGLIGNPPNWSANAVVTFANTWAAAPACIAAWEGTAAYGYYVQTVTTTTTTATIKLGGNLGVGLATKGWSPGDAFTMLCGGTQ